MNGMTKPKPALVLLVSNTIAKARDMQIRKPATPAMINIALVIVPRALFGTVRAACASATGLIGAP